MVILPKLVHLLTYLGCVLWTRAHLWVEFLITNFTVNVVATQHVALFLCRPRDLQLTSMALMDRNRLVRSVHLDANYTLRDLLTRHNHAKTCVVVDCGCDKSSTLLSKASAGRYFNKTYQWLLWDTKSVGLDKLLPLEMNYLGPNAQVTYVNGTELKYILWDVHSKGRHLKSPLEINLFAEYEQGQGLKTQNKDITLLQGIHSRDQFNGLTLRGASVIDQDNITTNEQIERILSHPRKDSGVAAFNKFHYELLVILRERLNFTVNFRNARGWAGRLGNTKFRLGFLGIIMRNEADVGASGAFNRINRFAEFDSILHSWKFDAAFLYRFTPDLDTHGKSGNFLAPFSRQVWVFSVTTLFAVNFTWRLVEWLKERWQIRRHQQRQLEQKKLGSAVRRPQRRNSIFGDTSATTDVNDPNEKAHIAVANDETSLSGVLLKSFAAFCQQGMDPIPTGLPSRTIVFTMFLFSLVMYNYYTSSVVGGLLSNTAQGPATVNEIISSPLALSFEDIGYYKVLFKENKTPLMTNLLNQKLLPPRDPHSLPVYTNLEDAIPFIKNGSAALHCELVDAYPQIAKHFDVNDICDLRVVPGLLESEVLNWPIHKNSQYTEIFRTAMCRAREVGLIARLLRERQTQKPKCQALYTVYPVSFAGAMSAFLILLGGYLLSIIALFVEILKQHYFKTGGVF